MPTDYELNCFGCDPSDFKQEIEESLTFKLSGPGMIIMSLLSDTQAMVEFGHDKEEIRKQLNRVKFLVGEYFSSEEQ